MFMDKNDWSDDDLEDFNDGDTPVVPMSMIPTPQVLSGPNAEPYRASAYNERMARARNSITQVRRQSSGMIQANADSRPSSARNTLQQAAPLDVLAQEVEEMEIAEQQQMQHAQQMHQQNEYAREQAREVHYPPQRAQYAGGGSEPVDIADDAPPPSSSSARRDRPVAQYNGSPGSDEPLPPENLPPPNGHSPPAQTAVSIPRQMENMAPAVIDTSDLRSFLMRPGPQGAMVQCYIQRRKSGLARLYPTYEVYLKDGEQFLLAARRRKNKKQSNYKVSLDREDLSRHSSNFFGKLKSNLMGTEFQMYDNGVNPDKLTPDQRDGSGSQVRQELATILYKQNVLGSRGPRKMKVLVPNVNEEGVRAVLRPTTMEDTMIERYKAGKESDNVQVLKNKQPKWNDQVGAYVLNFNGRVTRASVKNFQLCNVARDPDLVVMQFGRVGKDAFTMDYQWPLCGLQAFGIALSSFDYKIACE